MGCCVNSKLVPESPTNTQLKVVLFFGQDAQSGKVSNGMDSKQKHSQTSTGKESDIDRSNRKHGYNLHGMRSLIVKLKFHPRVTAKYDIKALIGSGSFSRVVRVEHRLTKQPYAIKMIDRFQGKEVYEAEVQVLRRVKHRYIIQLVEVFESTDKIYMVMELATGGELFDRIIAKGNFTERDAARVLRMVLDGVGYLHGLGIAHRDLKPENLLYYHPGVDSKIMITDFGLSHMMSGPDSCMTTTCGTPEYIAPEILARQAYTVQVDLWAIGVIAYILLSGTMPFDDENRTRLYRVIIKAGYSFPGEHWKEVTSLAKDFIDKTLVVDPRERLTVAKAMRHPWLASRASSSQKNLYRHVSHNLLLLKESTRSARSTRSGKSKKSDPRFVHPEDIDALHKDPEVQVELASMSSLNSHLGTYTNST